MILDRFKVPKGEEVYISEHALRQTVTAMFEKVGLTPSDAAEAADVLTMTDLRAVETHGVSNMLRLYLQDYQGGRLNPATGWEVQRETASTAFGHHHRAQSHAPGNAKGQGSRRRSSGCL
jgi:LDH2 family malate/lactate/ureidoglycolate dehydrogenase